MAAALALPAHAQQQNAGAEGAGVEKRGRITASRHLSEGGRLMVAFDRR